MTEVGEESSQLIANQFLSHGSETLRQKHGLSLGFNLERLNHYLAVHKMISVNKFHANPIRGNKEREVISQICGRESLCSGLITA